MILLLFISYFRLSTEAVVTDGSKELLLSQIVWRHGDRSPTGTYKDDPYQEDYWTFGGGGFGQLSPTGMLQHVKLGKLIRDLYITKSNFLDDYYNSKQVYVRSTDVNRTLISAMSNIIGMYGQNDYSNRKNIDYPDSPLWPGSFVPIAVHTVPDQNDYLLNSGDNCQRRDQLWEMAKTSAELQAFQNSPDVVSLLQFLTSKAGETIDIDNLWYFYDNLSIEQEHCPDFMEKIPWYNDSLYAQIVRIEDQVDLYKNGVFNQTLNMNGLDIGHQLQQARGGELINDILMHMDIKTQCALRPPGSHCTTWTNLLKYYVYSAHDTTLYGLLTVMGIEHNVSSRGYPLYSAALITELWLDHADNQTYFKALYHSNENTTFAVVTSDVTGCPAKSDYCDVGIYRSIAQKYKLDIPMTEWCEMDPRIVTSINPTSTAASSTTQTTVTKSVTMDLRLSVLAFVGLLRLI